MGINDREQDARSEKQARKREARRQKRQAGRQAIKLEDLWNDALPAAIAAVIGQGGAVRFGATRDGGAWAIGLYGDGDTPYTEYVQPGESLEAYLAQLRSYWDGLNGGNSDD